MKRREFFKSILGLTGAVAIAPFILTTLNSSKAFTEESRRKKSGGGDSDMVDPKEATAKAVGYVEDSKKAPKAAGNNCANCALYVKTEMKNGNEVGTCAIFPKKFVLGNGYCNSWAKKA